MNVTKEDHVRNEIKKRSAIRTRVVYTQQLSLQLLPGFPHWHIGLYPSWILLLIPMIGFCLFSTDSWCDVAVLMHFGIQVKSVDIVFWGSSICFPVL